MEQMVQLWRLITFESRFGLGFHDSTQPSFHCACNQSGLCYSGQWVQNFLPGAPGPLLSAGTGVTLQFSRWEHSHDRDIRKHLLYSPACPCFSIVPSHPAQAHDKHHCPMPAVTSFLFCCRQGNALPHCRPYLCAFSCCIPLFPTSQTHSHPYWLHCQKYIGNSFLMSIYQFSNDFLGGASPQDTFSYWYRSHTKLNFQRLGCWPLS